MALRRLMMHGLKMIALSLYNQLVHLLLDVFIHRDIRGVDVLERE